jgi:peptidoglycan/xylan/chitin deacetylase (PgdA/CDA1 family)
VLLTLAIGAVASERLGRRGLLLVIPGLLLCVAVAGAGPRLVNRAGGLATAPAAPREAALAVPAAPAAPTERPPAASTSPTEAAPLKAVATATPGATVAAVPTGIGGAPNTVTPTSSPTSAPKAASAIIAPTVAPMAASTMIAPTIAPTATVVVTPAPRPRSTTVIPILMYHYVRGVADPKDQVGINLSVKPANFDAQMQYLADNGYTTLTMQEVYEILNGQKTLPAKPIALTFDDGYRDFYTNAWPILQKHGFKATNYVVTDFIGQENYLTWPMLQELDTTGRIEIGAHSRSHSDLRAISGERRWDEIIGSKSILEQGLGHPIGAFCYPAGFHNAAVIADVKRANFLTATTVEPGTKQNLQFAHALPRIRVHGPDPLATWAGKLP